MAFRNCILCVLGLSLCAIEIGLMKWKLCVWYICKEHRNQVNSSRLAALICCPLCALYTTQKWMWTKAARSKNIISPMIIKRAIFKHCPLCGHSGRSVCFARSPDELCSARCQSPISLHPVLYKLQGRKTCHLCLPIPTT